MERKNMFWVLFWFVAAWMSGGTNGQGTKWAFLIASSKDFVDYRHQSNVCHAYHVLKDGGLRDENIIVMMYDDIAYNEENRHQGTIYNKPDGPNVYDGVPKDYTGEDVNVVNIYEILSGTGRGTGGSGKVLRTGSDDTIFIYISGNGAYRRIIMPFTDLWAEDFVEALIAKHKSNSYKKMVIYIDADEAGSMFEGHLPNDINVYATTSCVANESSIEFYCPGSPMPPPPEYEVCLGDLYSITWMEDSETSDRSSKTLQQQYSFVRDRSIPSHVTEYGDLTMQQEPLVTYMGALAAPRKNAIDNSSFNTTYYKTVTQDDAHLSYLKLKLERAPFASEEKVKAQKALEAEMDHRERDDRNVLLMWNRLFGKETSFNMLAPVRQPAVDETNCLKMLKKTYELHCGAFSIYGSKYMRTFGNICSAGFSKEQMIDAVTYACPLKN